MTGDPGTRVTFPEPPASTDPVGIGGWLLYFAITLPAGVLLRVYSIVTYLGALGPRFAAPPQLLVPLTAIQALILVVDAGVIALFFYRSKLAPPAIVVQRIVSVAASLALLLLRPPVSNVAWLSWAAFGFGVGTAALVIVYLRLSVRVRNTFVR